jgi:hypothetical protein
MDYARPTDFYLWRTYDGQLQQRYVKRPQPWSKLVEQASEHSETRLPAALRTHPEFAVMFMLVYPHRFGSGLLKLVESLVAAESKPAEERGTATGRRGQSK